MSAAELRTRNLGVRGPRGIGVLEIDLGKKNEEEEEWSNEYFGGREKVWK